MRYFGDFSMAINKARRDLIDYGEDVDTGRWQGVPTQGKPDLITRELLSWCMAVPVGRGCTLTKREWDTDEMLDHLVREIRPNLPWADDHFAERVGRKPTNPGKAYLDWPWWHGQESSFDRDHQKFTHTYQERFWPRYATDETRYSKENLGIRYRYGDLDDLVDLLARDPYTRQAYIPIFFPEDTGAVHGGRIPCSLGYHFMLRDNKLHLWYDIRSCDYVRHLRDDIYLACRLLLWVLQQLFERELRSDAPQLWVDVDPGYLYMSIHSLHFHRGDMHHVRS